MSRLAKLISAMRLQQGLASSYLKVNRDDRVDSVSFVFGCGLAPAGDRQPARAADAEAGPGCEVPR
jgi:hypothetical protein